MMMWRRLFSLRICKGSIIVHIYKGGETVTAVVSEESPFCHLYTEVTQYSHKYIFRKIFGQ